MEIGEIGRYEGEQNRSGLVFADIYFEIWEDRLCNIKTNFTN